MLCVVLGAATAPLEFRVGVLVFSGSDAAGVVDGDVSLEGSSPLPAPPLGHWKPDIGPLFVGAGAGALICVVGATIGLGVSDGMLGEASSAGGDATGALGGAEVTTERVSLVGIGAKIPDTDGVMSEVGTAGYPDGTGVSEDTAGVSDGTGTGE
jgi:hypothetical protein